MKAVPLLMVFVLLGAVALAVREDTLTHRIPNRLTGPLLCCGLALQLVGGGWSGLGNAVFGALLGFAVLMPFHLARAMGAGDVKLLAACGSLLGPTWTGVAAIYTLLAGAALALGYLSFGAVRAAATPAGASLMFRIHSAQARLQQARRERFPYAIAIALGALAAVFQRGDLQSLAAWVQGRNL